MNKTLEEQIAHMLIKHKKTLAVAESCTGGLASHRLTNIPGSSGFFKLGICAYANEAKNKLLGISSRTLLKYGAVSRQVAQCMARGVRKKAKTDYGIGITGIAGPTGATKNKPIGLTYIAVSYKNKVIYRKYIFKGTRKKIKSQAASGALTLLSRLL